MIDRRGRGLGAVSSDHMGLASGAPPATARRPVASGEIVEIFGVPFSALSYEEARELLLGFLRDGGPHQIVIANAHTLNLACADADYRRILRGAALVLPDGVGVQLAAALLGRRFPHNFVGTDFVPRLLGDLAVRVFLYGSAPGVAWAAAEVVRRCNPALRVVGVEHGYQDPESVPARVAAARPHVLLVALGNPLQERWIARHLEQTGTRIAIGVGALFDNLAGRVPRAPLWVRRLKSEWVFRLYLEPRRQWRRYLIGNPVFLWRVLASRVWERR